MKQGTTNGFPRLTPSSDNPYLPEILDSLDTGDCSKNLGIVISLLEKCNWRYCNNAFKKMLGNRINQFHDHGWDFWFETVTREEALPIKKKRANFLNFPNYHKVLQLHYHICNGAGRVISVRHEMVLHRKPELTFVVNYLYNITEKERIEHCLDLIADTKGTSPINLGERISPREKEVLTLIADGYSSKQIAERLFISNHTAISHRKHLIEKFGVKNTAQLIKKASKIMEL